MIKFYLKTDNDGTVLDAITYPHEGYTLFESESLPIGVNGGWWKLENGQLVEYPELRPNEDYKDESMSIEALMEENTTLKLAIAELAEKQELARIENQLALAELAETLLLGGNE